MGKLISKRALVTGGGQGIGRAIVDELLRQGCHVAIHYHSSGQGAEEAKRGAPPNATVGCLQGDLTGETTAQQLVDRAVELLGGLDVLINNTGDLVGRRPVEQIDAPFWRKVIDVNLTSMMLVTRAAVPHLVKSGQSSVVNLASLAGRMGGHNGSLVYSAAKGAVLTWTRALATELGGRGVRVNAVAPGLILGTSFHNTHTTPESAAATVARIPLRRAGTAAEVARAVAYLASEYDGFITGATLDINGGVYGS
jgi:3-oxoacyl-[acyl-carrier protein] reductase